MKHIIELDDTNKCLEEILEISNKIDEMLDKSEELKESMKHGVVFLKVSDVAAMLGFTIPTTREIFNRPDFPKCNYGKEMVVEFSALKNYFSKPVLKGDF